MSFNELNSVEHYIIHQLTGVNLNEPGFQEPKEVVGFPWKFIPADLIRREITEVLWEEEITKALIRLNPSIAALPERAEEVIYKLRAVLITVNQTGLVRANEEFAKWLCGDKTMPFGENNRHVPVRLIDFDHPENNSYYLTHQFRVRARETKIPDLVFFLNGFPVITGEAKTPIRPSISWFDGAYEIHHVYEDAVPQLFVPNLLSFATEGKELFYGAVRVPLDLWSPWRLETEKDQTGLLFNLQEVGKELTHLLHPKTLLDILGSFALYSTNSRKQRIKIICRYQQYEGANKLIRRVTEGRQKKGLIWHFQGSGKSLLMVFAAQKLRRMQELKSPTVIIVVDRVDLDTQITGTFNAADVSNLVTADSIRQMKEFLEQDTRKVIITTIHKFQDAYPNMNLRDNIILMVDEAHRTQEGDLGRRMRAALPNAFLFGLTGTPINKSDHNTFWAFGSDEDEGGYMSLYSFQDSLRDRATLPLHFEPRLLNVHVDKETIDKLFSELKEEAALTDEEADKLSKHAAKMSAFLKSPERITTITEDIIRHFYEKVDPHGLKAMIVAPDRHGCVLYKEELDRHIPPEASAVVISTTANDEYEFKQRWGLDRDQQEKLIDKFNDPNSPLKFLIVTAKLLTGFDSPILQTMYLDKSLKDHTLLQAVCRTNRLYKNKTFGRIVDYFGVFDDAALALQFDEESVRTIITNLKELMALLPLAMADALQHFEGVDRSVAGFEGLEAAQNCIGTDEKRDAFARDYIFLAKLWESLSPDTILDPYEKDYRWLTQVYESVKPSSGAIGRIIWQALGAKTIELIHQNIHVEGITEDQEEFVLDAEVIDEILLKKDPKRIKKLEKELIRRFARHPGNPKFKALSERLEELRDKAERGLISSIEFVKMLCQLARDTVHAEREEFSQEEQKSAKTALTELFLETKTDQTPAIVARIVNDIDEIVKFVRFPGWQTTAAGEREVQRSLRKTLLKYNLHKDQELFERAYGYIKEYY